MSLGRGPVRVLVQEGNSVSYIVRGMALAVADEVFNGEPRHHALKCLMTRGLRNLACGGIGAREQGLPWPLQTQGNEENRSESKPSLDKPLTSPAKVPTRDPSLKLWKKPEATIWTWI